MSQKLFFLILVITSYAQCAINNHNALPPFFSLPELPLPELLLLPKSPSLDIPRSPESDSIQPNDFFNPSWPDISRTGSPLHHQQALVVDFLVPDDSLNSVHTPSRVTHMHQLEDSSDQNMHITITQEPDTKRRIMLSGKKRALEEQKKYLNHCPLCTEIFENLQTVIEHIAAHHLYKKLKNLRCNRQLYEKAIIQKILQSGQQPVYEKSKRSGQCPDSPCPFFSEEWSNTRRHWKTKHLFTLLPSATPAQCCEYDTVAMRLMPQSLQPRSRWSQSRMPLQKEARTPKIRKVEQDTLRNMQKKCPKCEKILSAEYVLKRHIEQQHNKTIQFSCTFDDCKYACSYKWNCIRHINMQHLLSISGNEHVFPFPCRIQSCKNRFPTAYFLQKHLMDQHDLPQSKLAKLLYQDPKSQQMLNGMAREYMQEH